MSIQVTYRRLPENELAELERDPERALSYLFSLPGIDIAEVAALPDDQFLAAFEKANSDPTRVDLDKDWHALHFLLTNDPSMDPEHRPTEPLHNVVMGGQPTRIDATYGPVRRFSVDDIRQIVDALSGVTVDQLRSRFSVDAFNAAKIYPNPRPGGWNAEEIETVLQIFPRLQKFFSEALAQNEVVIVYSA